MNNDPLETIWCRELIEGGNIELYIDKKNGQKLLARFVNSTIYPNDIFVFPEQKIDQAISLLKKKNIDSRIKIKLYSQL